MPLLLHVRAHFIITILFLLTFITADAFAQPGLSMLRDINQQDTGTSTQNVLPRPFGNRAIFIARAKNSDRRVPWITDGTALGTKEISLEAPFAASSAQYIYDKVSAGYFAAFNGSSNLGFIKYGAEPRVTKFTFPNEPESYSPDIISNGEWAIASRFGLAYLTDGTLQNTRAFTAPNNIYCAHIDTNYLVYVTITSDASSFKLMRLDTNTLQQQEIADVGEHPTFSSCHLFNVSGGILLAMQRGGSSTLYNVPFKLITSEGLNVSDVNLFQGRQIQFGNLKNNPALIDQRLIAVVQEILPDLTLGPSEIWSTDGTETGTARALTLEANQRVGIYPDRLNILSTITQGGLSKFFYQSLKFQNNSQILSTKTEVTTSDFSALSPIASQVRGAPILFDALFSSSNQKCLMHFVPETGISSNLGCPSSSILNILSKVSDGHKERFIIDGNLITDGTPYDTRKFSPVNSTESSLYTSKMKSSPEIFKLGSYALFEAQDNTGSPNMYVSDGTAAGTKTLSSAIQSLSGLRLTKVGAENGRLVVAGHRRPYEIFRIALEGALTATKIMEVDFRPLSGGFYQHDSKAFFYCEKNGGLCMADLSQFPIGVETVGNGPLIFNDFDRKDFFDRTLAGLGSKVVYVNNTSGEGNEPWVIDAVTMEKSPLGINSPGAGSSKLRFYGQAVGRMLLSLSPKVTEAPCSAISSSCISKLYSTDGTVTGTLAESEVGQSSQFIGLQTFLQLNRGHLIEVAGQFILPFGSRFYRLDMSDPPGFGLRLLNIPSNIQNSSIRMAMGGGVRAAVLNDKLYYLSKQPNLQLVSFDPLEGTASAVFLFDSGSHLGSILTTGEVIADDSKVYFYRAGDLGSEYWESDGTASGTRKILSSSVPYNELDNRIVPINGNLLFYRTTIDYGAEPWAIGTAGDIDLCPFDPYKSRPGICGCGLMEGEAGADTDCRELFSTEFEFINQLVASPTPTPTPPASPTQTPDPVSILSRATPPRPIIRINKESGKVTVQLKPFPLLKVNYQVLSKRLKEKGRIRIGADNAINGKRRLVTKNKISLGKLRPDQRIVVQYRYLLGGVASSWSPVAVKRRKG